VARTRNGRDPDESPQNLNVTMIVGAGLAPARLADGTNNCLYHMVYGQQNFLRLLIYVRSVFIGFSPSRE